MSADFRKRDDIAVPKGLIKAPLVYLDKFRRKVDEDGSPSGVLCLFMFAGLW